MIWGAFLVIEPIYVREVLHGSPTMLALLQTTFGVGLAAHRRSSSRASVSASRAVRIAAIAAAASGVAAVLYVGTAVPSRSRSSGIGVWGCVTVVLRRAGPDADAAGARRSRPTVGSWRSTGRSTAPAHLRRAAAGRRSPPRSSACRSRASRSRSSRSPVASSRCGAAASSGRRRRRRPGARRPGARRRPSRTPAVLPAAWRGWWVGGTGGARLGGVADRPQRLDDDAVAERLAELSGWDARRATRSAKRSSGRASRPRSRSSCASGSSPRRRTTTRTSTSGGGPSTSRSRTHDAGGLSDARLRPRGRDRRGRRVVIFVVVLVAASSALAVALVVGVAQGPGSDRRPTSRSATSTRWDLGDFDVVYRLSGPELHDGLRKAEWVDAPSAPRTAVRSASGARRGDGRGGGRRAGRRRGGADPARRCATAASSTTRCGSLRRSRAWQVVGYQLRPAAAA